jgi:c-di-GMP-binding flagellar brake protein YcgR
MTNKLKMNGMSAETRTQKRVRLNLSVKLKVLDGQVKAPKETEGRLHDLSVGGCAFYHQTELPIGTRVEVHIELNEALARKFKRPELSAKGVICRIEKHRSKFLLSVRFQK